MSILSVKNLSKSFGKLEVLNDISFNVEQGEVISIIGPSGSGKSTLLRCINQFEKIDSGECEICGITMTRNDENGKAVYADNKTLHDIRLKIGLVFQNFNLFPHLFIRLSGNPKRQADKNTYYTSPIKHISHLCFRFTSDN